MKKLIPIISFAFLVGISGCKKDSEFLDIPPTQVIPEEVAFSDPALVLSILGNLYNRQLDFSSLDGYQRPYANDGDNEPGWRTFADFSESFPSENGSYYIVQRTGWSYDEWQVDWNRSYAYIRDLNLFIQRDSASTQLAVADKVRFLAEGRFLRANFYFELVKRMGGVPLILRPLVYDLKGDPTYLQTPRAKESDIYDFVISEAEAIKNDLPADPAEKSRATKAAALAMEARAALYAGSIAKYGASTPQVSLPGQEVGIPADKASEYYTKALAAAQEIINGGAGGYKLYQVIFISGIFLSCKKDNYSSPQSQLTGALMYNSDTVRVEYNRVPFQLYQYGFGKVGPIEGTFSQDGMLDALLFNGDYKLIIPNGQGPFLWKQTALGTPDSLAITMGGNQISTSRLHLTI